jgi:hypothetical protein
VIELTTIYCPECGDAAEDMAPENEHDVDEAPGYRYVADRTALYSVLTRAGWRPAEPVEGDHDEADV